MAADEMATSPPDSILKRLKGFEPSTFCMASDPPRNRQRALEPAGANSGHQAIGLSQARFRSAWASRRSRCPNDSHRFELGPNATRRRKASVVQQHDLNPLLELEGLEDANSNPCTTRLAFSGLDFSFYPIGAGNRT